MPAGDVIVVRYADDSVMGFEEKKTARTLPAGYAGALRQIRTELSTSTKRG